MCLQFVSHSFARQDSSGVSDVSVNEFVSPVHDDSGSGSAEIAVDVPVFLLLKQHLLSLYKSYANCFLRRVVEVLVGDDKVRQLLMHEV